MQFRRPNIIGATLLMIVSLFSVGYSYAAEWVYGSHSIWEADYNNDGLQDVLLIGQPDYIKIPYDIDVQIKGQYGSYVLQRNSDNEGYTFIVADSEVELQSLDLQESDYQIQMLQDDAIQNPSYILFSPTREPVHLESVENGTSATLARVFPTGTPSTTKELKQTDLNDDGKADLLFLGEGIQHASLANEPGKYNMHDGSEVSSLSGHASVSAMGSAQYHIPIQLPEGVGGLTPTLALSYDGNQGPGVLADGWNLNGLQKISRCRATVATEGYGHSMPNSQEDRFCLNGNKLINILGEYGADGTEYRTEIEQFSKVVSYGSYGSRQSGPMYFKVWTKNGLILEFGNTEDSRNIMSFHPNTVIADWHLNRVTDLFNNTYSVQYSESNNYIYPNSISYSPNVMVEFEYQTRSYNLDSIRYFKAGSEVSLTRLMTGISIKKDGRETRNYNISYENSPVTSKYRVAQVGECAQRINAQEAICKEPITFNWSLGDKGFGASGGSSLPSADKVSGRQAVTTDINGDGFTDLLWVSDGYWWIAEGYQSGFRDSKNTLISFGATGKYAGLAVPIRVGDSNKMGLLMPTISAEVVSSGDERYGISELFTWRLITFEFDGSNYDVSIGNTFFKNLGHMPRVGDFNGDGLEDIIVFFGDIMADIYHVGATMIALQLDDEGTARHFFSTTHPSENIEVSNGLNFSSTFHNGIYSAPATTELNASSLADAKVSDLNGDGLSDILMKGDRFWYRVETLYQSYGSIMRKTQTIIPRGDGEDGNGTAVDINNDGLLDMLVRVDGEWSFYINTGKEYRSLDTRISTAGDPEHTLVLDYNHDGRMDVLLEDNGSWKMISKDFSGGRFGGYSLTNLPELDSFRKPFYKYEHRYNGPIRPDICNAVTRCLFGYGQPLPVDPESEEYTSSLGDFDEPGEVPITVDIDRDGFLDILYYERGELIDEEEQVYAPGDWRAVYLKGDEPDLLRSVTKQAGVTASFGYSSLSGPVHTYLDAETEGYQFPNMPFRGSRRVVSSLSQRSNVSLQSQRYSYKGAKVHLQGRGHLGFSEIEVTNVSLNQKRRTRFNQTFPHIGAVESSTTLYDDVVIQEVNNTWASDHVNDSKTIFPYLEGSLAKVHETNGALVSTTQTSYTYDGYGNVTSEVSRIGRGVNLPGKMLSTFSEYEPPSVEGENWLVGFLNKQVVSSGLLRTETNFTSWENTLEIGSVTQNAGTDSWSTISYARDSVGNITSTTIDGSDIEQFTSTRASDFLDDIYPQTLQNSMNHSMQVEYDQLHGQPTKIVDMNSLETHREYDVWGRQTYQKDADGSETYLAREWCDATCPELAAYKVTTLLMHSASPKSEQAPSSGLGRAPSIVYYDVLGREIRQATYSHDGKTVYMDTEYDLRKGFISRQSLPYYKGDTPIWTTYDSYDSLGRLLSSTKPDGSTVSFLYESDPTYSRRVVQTNTIINPDDTTSTQITTKYYSARGLLSRVTDSDGVHTDYTYDYFDRLESTTVDGQIATRITLEYDVAGNKTKLIDPDAGRTDYSYNSLGQMLSMTDANARNQSDVRNVEFRYDTLGRVTQRIDNDGTYNWVYDTADNAIGLVAEVSGPDYTETYQYDDYSRVRKTSAIIFNEPERVTSYVYDGYSRLSSIKFPSNFSVKSNYNWLGYKTSLNDALTGLEYWSISDTNVMGAITEVRFGNGVSAHREYNSHTGRLEQLTTKSSAQVDLQNLSYTYNSIGNLQSRSSNINGSELLESFTYDNLNRLTTATTIGLSSGRRVLGYQYDSLGNITYKSDVSDLNGYKYESGRPHAVSSIVKSGKTTLFEYDDNGNAIRSGARTLSYNAYNKPTQITQANKKHIFRYGPDGGRFYQEKRLNNEVVQKNYYLSGGAYEEVHDLTKGEIKRKTMISGIMLHISTTPIEGGPEQSQINYLHSDLLGSTDLITDSEGEVVGRFAFDPFGQRRHHSWEDMSAVNLGQSLDELNSLTTRGFTGHEQLDDVSLIHMNGRVYDPVVGRFLSADPLIQSPDFSQSYNRYSYVWNNPLNMVDPSGYAGLRVDAEWIYGGSVSGDLSLVSATLDYWSSGVGSSGVGSSGGGSSGGGSSGGGSSGGGSWGGSGSGSTSITNSPYIGHHPVITTTPCYFCQTGSAGSSRHSGRTYRNKSSVEIGDINAPIYSPVRPRLTPTKNITANSVAQKARAPGQIYITGHNVGGYGPIHTAIEYDNGAGAQWISGGPEGLTWEGAQYLVGGVGNAVNGLRPTDAPAFNHTLGIVIPPKGMSPEKYFNVLTTAANSYQNNVDYDLFPGIMDSYNSNSYVSGLIKATGGTPSIDMSQFYGGGKPLPAKHFGY